MTRAESIKRAELFKEFLKNKKNLTIREKLIKIHLPLVKKISSKFSYYPNFLTRADLFQVGILGLIKALDNYEDLGYDFLAYSKPTILSAISHTMGAKDA